MNFKHPSVLIVACLFCTYFFWGSTYLAIRFGIESFPPFLMAAMRFIIAGGLMYVAIRLYGTPNPSLAQWGGATIVGILLPAFGNGTVCYVQQTINSSVAALAIATAPIWMAIFSSLWGHKITRQEWIGMAIGMIGMVLLNSSDSLHGHLSDGLLLIFAAASWSFGSVWSKHLPMPQGLMGAACQMLTGGLVLALASSMAGEDWPVTISAKSWGAMLFLIVLGSLVAYSAYQWLLKNVRPLVASSNTFVNPIVAFIVGIWLADEAVTTNELVALAVILLGVVLILTSETKTT